jgi:hypothetical protein
MFDITNPHFISPFRCLIVCFAFKVINERYSEAQKCGVFFLKMTRVQHGSELLYEENFTAYLIIVF